MHWVWLCKLEDNLKELGVLPYGSWVSSSGCDVWGKCPYLVSQLLLALKLFVPLNSLFLTGCIVISLSCVVLHENLSGFFFLFLFCLFSEHLGLKFFR